MFKELREALRIVRQYKKLEGYTGTFAIIPEDVMEEVQLTCGRVLAENKKYFTAFEALLDGKSICDYCWEGNDCVNYERWTEGRCKDFLLLFPDDDEAVEAFNECYKQCDQTCKERGEEE